MLISKATGPGDFTGVTQVSCVSEMTVASAGRVPNLHQAALPRRNLEPVTVMVVPPVAGPVTGVIEVTCTSLYSKVPEKAVNCAAFPTPSSALVETSIKAIVATDTAGATQSSSVAEMIVAGTRTPPIPFTAPMRHHMGAAKLLPDSLKFVPIRGPCTGYMRLTVGSARNRKLMLVAG
jgi:hypothetical protein